MRPQDVMREDFMSKHILVVEDQQDNRQILHDLLGHAGYELSEVESGMEALSAVAEPRPDLILMDISASGHRPVPGGAPHQVPPRPAPDPHHRAHPPFPHPRRRQPPP